MLDPARGNSVTGLRARFAYDYTTQPIWDSRQTCGQCASLLKSPVPVLAWQTTPLFDIGSSVARKLEPAWPSAYRSASWPAAYCARSTIRRTTLLAARAEPPFLCTHRDASDGRTPAALASDRPALQSLTHGLIGSSRPQGCGAGVGCGDAWGVGRSSGRQRACDGSYAKGVRFASQSAPSAAKASCCSSLGAWASRSQLEPCSRSRPW